jgi:cytochrome c peroxidase
VPPIFSEPGWPMHSAEEMGIDDFQASRSPEKKFYRTTPLRGLFVREKGGFYHDGRFKTYMDVVEHYNRHFGLQLTAEEKNQLVQYLKSL